MKPSKNSVMMSAALAGLLSGTMTRATAATPQAQDSGKMTSTKTKVEKHSCAGKNSCKGKGGCATDGSKENNAAKAGIAEKHACAGQNSCKGNGGCATKKKS